MLHGKPRFDLSLLRRLIRLRNEHPLFVYGDFKPLATGVADVYAFEGSLEEDRAVVLLNGALSPIPNRVEARGANLELGPPPDTMKAADP